MRNQNRIGAIVLTAAFAAAFATGVNFAAPPATDSQTTLTWVAPLTTSNLRIGRRPQGRTGGPDAFDVGETAKYCSGTVSLPGGDQLSCKIPAADTAYEYYVCATDPMGENLGGFECSFYGNGGGWECIPADIAASWCD